MTMGTMGGESLLAQVREGMAVRDAGGQRIGTVRAVQFGDGGDPADARQQAREAIADVQAAVREPDRRPLEVGDVEAVGVGGLSGDGGHPLGPLVGATSDNPRVPTLGVADEPLGAGDERRDARGDLPPGRGYIRIDSKGLFASDRYATADQLAGVDADGVRLSVAGDALRAD